MENYHPCDQEMISIKVLDVEASSQKQEEEEVHMSNIGSEDYEEEVIQIKVEGNSKEAGDEKVKEDIIRREFKQFDIVSLTGEVKNGIILIVPPNPQIRIWTTIILEKSLPDSVYVRVLEHNVARAVIIGGAGTPYSHGLFFFDILLPPNYPNVPPEVRSCYTLPCSNLEKLQIYNRTPEYGARTEINPLAKTWDSNVSTILDRLVSIQLSFQTENPYFRNPSISMNDPHLVEATKAGYKLKLDESFDCNERIFKETCLTMLATLRYPSKHFEEFVALHFHDRAETILTTCNPHRIRYGDRSRHETKLCKGYQESMLNVYTKLLKAFIKNGSSLDDFIGDINLDEDESGYVERHIKFTRRCCLGVCLILAFVSMFFTWGTYEMFIRRNS
ncbi:hypothetical protein MKW98_021348 [Papaver atlanticum]|uniref:UBC core domain-containing protein n=1 Tax=Papaver atlanticum TaxID=357466 RepID=A0AAD4XHJ3_9MAGN|nr:hypothetical protein MKW98_021348 [Papaver atlanticum]